MTRATKRADDVFILDDEVPPKDINDDMPQDSAPLPDDVDESECLPEDDGYNVYRVMSSQDYLLRIDQQELVEYMYSVMLAKRKLTSVFEERKRAMNRQIESLEKALRTMMVERETQKQSYTFADDDGNTVSVSIAPSHDEHYSVSDWEAVYDWIAANNTYDILQKRVHSENLKFYLSRLDDMVNSGEITAEDAVVPGVSLVSVPVLSVNTRKVPKKTK